MTWLPDVNVLIALLDPTHTHHNDAHAWFAEKGRISWATCPLTENGVLRILSHPKYPNSQRSPAAIAEIVVRLRQHPGHVFWADSISLLDEGRIETDRLLSTGQVTDSYLLALAVAQGGQLATFDRRLLTTAVRDGVGALHTIPLQTG